MGQKIAQKITQKRAKKGPKKSPKVILMLLNRLPEDGPSADRIPRRRERERLAALHVSFGFPKIISNLGGEIHRRIDYLHPPSGLGGELSQVRALLFIGVQEISVHNNVVSVEDVWQVGGKVVAVRQIKYLGPDSIEKILA